jgi:hypothetical protein
MKIVGVEKYNDDSQKKPKIVGVEKYNTENSDYKASGNIQLNNESGLNPERQKLVDIYNAAKPYAQTAGRFAAGAAAGGIQGAANSLASTANLVPQTVNLIAGTRLPTFQKTDVMRQFLPKDSQAANYGFEAGNIGGELAGFGGAYKATGAIPKLNDASSTVQNMLRGSLAGFSTGEDAPGGRIASGVVSGVAAPVSQLTNKNIINTVAKNYKDISGQYKNAFTKYFDQAPNEIKPLREYGVVPQETTNYKVIKQDLSGPQKESLQNYFKKPTLENAHFAQSELGKYVETLKKAQRRNQSTFTKGRELNAANEAYIGIKDSINNALDGISSISGKDVLNPYLNLKSGYQSDVIPYHGNQLDEYLNNTIKSKNPSKKVVDNLLRDQQFMKYQVQNGRKIPGPGSGFTSIKARSYIDSILNKKNASLGLSASALTLLGLDKYTDKERVYGDTQ